MNTDSDDSGGADTAEEISKTIESSVRAWFVLIRAPLLIYAECLKMVAKTVSDVADGLQQEKDSN
jgi:hypothetical protein